jgi:hypothetical protein
MFTLLFFLFLLDMLPYFIQLLAQIFEVLSVRTLQLVEFVL